MGVFRKTENSTKRVRDRPTKIVKDKYITFALSAHCKSNFKTSTIFHNFGQIPHTKFHNVSQISQRWTKSTISTELHNFSQISQSGILGILGISGIRAVSLFLLCFYCFMEQTKLSMSAMLKP